MNRRSIGSVDPHETFSPFCVLARKGREECAVGDTVTIQLQDLQEMANYLRATVDQGLGQLASQPPNGTIPPPPNAASPAPMDSSFVAIPPPPDPSAPQEIERENELAAQLEKQAVKP